MILYKYLPPARIDCIQNCLIRFTQYGDFNDPFELNLNIDKIADENEIRELVGRDFLTLVEEEYAKNPILSAFISKEAFINLALTREESVKNLVVGIQPDVVRLLPGMLQKSVNSLMGALSLSEIDDHELMWAHYAEEHKGYVIGFDSSHPFFNQKKSSIDELRHLRKIDYRDKRPAINLLNTSGSELFFVKSSKWKYEVEWRMLLPLSESAELVHKTPYPIQLFKFPAKAVERIILGAKISDENKRTVKSLLGDRKFSHVELCQARLDSSSYGIVIGKETG